jgi:protein required for attachment to host cells
MASIIGVLKFAAVQHSGLSNAGRRATFARRRHSDCRHAKATGEHTMPKQKPKTIWVVVADEAITRILEMPDDGGELRPVEELTEPAAHASGMALRRDAHGRRGSTVTSSAGVDDSHQVAEEFARRVAQRLTGLLLQHRFDELRIAAAPRFLGLLRNNFGKPLEAVISKQLDKDLVHLSNREITDRLCATDAPA